jgi:hypothetical protein
MIFMLFRFVFLTWYGKFNTYIYYYILPFFTELFKILTPIVTSATAGSG